MLGYRQFFVCGYFDCNWFDCFFSVLQESFYQLVDECFKRSQKDSSKNVSVNCPSVLATNENMENDCKSSATFLIINSFTFFTFSSVVDVLCQDNPYTHHLQHLHRHREKTSTICKLCFTHSGFTRNNTCLIFFKTLMHFIFLL